MLKCKTFSILIIGLPRVRRYIYLLHEVMLVLRNVSSLRKLSLSASLGKLKIIGAISLTIPERREYLIRFFFETIQWRER